MANSDNAGRRGPGSILEYDGNTGEFVRVFVNGKRRGWEHPKGLAFGGPNGNLFVLDDRVDDRGGGHESVQEFDGVTGKFIRVFIEDFRKWDLRDPWFMKFGPNGNLIVSDDTTFRPTLYEFDPATGDLIRVIIKEPRSSKKGFLYEPRLNTWLLVTRGLSHVERYDDKTGDFLETVIQGKPDLLMLNSPSDLAYGPGGNLFVSGTRTIVQEERRQDTGAIHEYDGVTYEQVRVFGNARGWPPTQNELYLPNAIEFKRLPGDFGGDHAGGDWDVDLADVSRFMNAFTGSGVRCRDALALTAFDADRDGDLDLDDYRALHAELTGPK